MCTQLRATLALALAVAPTLALTLAYTLILAQVRICEHALRWMPQIAAGAEASSKRRASNESNASTVAIEVCVLREVRAHEAQAGSRARAAAKTVKAKQKAARKKQKAHGAAAV